VSLVAQDMQRPAQAFSQQRFPTQAPFEHWLLAEQVDPLPSLAVQTLLAQ
jgi:hypothetical protein